MKIRLLAPFPPPYGGVALHSVRLLEGLRDHGVQASGISLGGLPDAIDDIVPFSPMVFLNRSLVHYHTDEGNHRWMRLLSRMWRMTRTPYVVTVHSFRHRPEFDDASVRRSLAAAFKNAKAVIAISDEVVNDLERRIGVRHKLTRTIPSNIPISQWETEFPLTPQIPQDWKDASVRLLANAGRIVSYQGKDLYGLDVLVDAMNRLDGDVRLCIAVGEIVDAAGWANLHSRIEGDPRISVVRNLQGPLVPAVRHAHIVIRPTRTEGGPSLTLSEALELGRWAVGSDSVTRPQGTVLFKNEDPSDLAHALERCIRDVRSGHMPPPMPPHVDAVQRIVNLYQRVTSDS
ncbi:MAG: glycosyltransferase family 4 protein [Bacteroidota bacterium]|jgi:glycosyltransferase involved in cell wall biosynthesis